jgi:hypothetical protein
LFPPTVRAVKEIVPNKLIPKLGPRLVPALNRGGRSGAGCRSARRRCSR